MVSKRNRLRSVGALLVVVMGVPLLGSCMPMHEPDPGSAASYLAQLEAALADGEFEQALASARAGLQHPGNPADEEYLRLGGAAALSALGRDAEALEFLKPLYVSAAGAKPAALGMSALSAQTLAVLTELELRDGRLQPAICALEVLFIQRGLEHETLRTAAVLYRGLGLPEAAAVAEHAAAELAYAHGRGRPPEPLAEPALNLAAVEDEVLGCRHYGGVPEQAGLNAYLEYLRFNRTDRAGRHTGEELDRYGNLEAQLHNYPGYYMGLHTALKALLPNYGLQVARPLLERTILPAPDGPYAMAARRELGVMLGIGEQAGELLLLGAEIERIAGRLLSSGVPETVAPVVAMLATPENPYRSAGRLLLLQARDLPGMRAYLEAQRAGAEGDLRRGLDGILAVL